MNGGGVKLLYLSRQNFPIFYYKRIFIYFLIYEFTKNNFTCEIGIYIFIFSMVEFGYWFISIELYWLIQQTKCSAKISE